MIWAVKQTFLSFYACVSVAFLTYRFFVQFCVKTALRYKFQIFLTQDMNYLDKKSTQKAESRKTVIFL